MEPRIWTPYCGAAPTPQEIAARWNFDPLLIAVLLFCAGGYWLAGHARTKAERRAFAGFLGVAVVLFISPFCALSSALFSARVVHHVVVAAPLALLLARSFDLRRIGGSIWLWITIQWLVFWVWHAPSVYGWALSNDAAYWLMQMSILLSACGFWTVLSRQPAPSAVAALLVTMVQMGLLGALITFSGSALYAPHFLGPQAWGLSPLEDQQLAGLIMWVPAAGIYLFAALRLLSRWLAREEHPLALR